MTRLGIAVKGLFARTAPVWIATLAEIDVLVTDRLPPGPIADFRRIHDVMVIETGGPTEPEALAD